MLERNGWAPGSEAGCCLAAVVLAAIPVINAISGLLWKFPLPRGGVGAPLRGEEEIKEWERKIEMAEGKQHCLSKLPSERYLLGQSRPRTLKSGLTDCMFCLQRNVRLGMTNTTSKPSTAEMSPKSLPHRTCEYHKRALLTSLIFN